MTATGQLNRIILHPLENGAAGENGAYNDTETGLGEDDVGGASGGVGSVSDSDTYVGLLQSRRIVDSVSGHSTDVFPFLQLPHDLVLVL